MIGHRLSRAVRTAAAVLSAVLVFGGLAGCQRSDAPELATNAFQGATMGTTFTVKVVTSEPLESLESAELEAAVADELAEVNARMSTYLDDSELSRFNRHASTEPFELSIPTLEVMAKAIEVSRLSGGAFDVTVGPLVNAWGFGPEVVAGQHPGDEELARLLEEIGWEKLELDFESATARKLHPGLYVDLSAIAKGYGVDRVAETLLERGYSNFMVEVGGEVRTHGLAASGEPWRIGIERPQLQRGVTQRVVELRDAAVATSGDYRNYREENERRISHIIDPRTGYPVAHRLSSVSVLSEKCLHADALATAILVLGPEEGWELAEREEIAAVLLVRTGKRDFEERQTPAFERFLAEVEGETPK